MASFRVYYLTLINLHQDIFVVDYSSILADIRINIIMTYIYSQVSMVRLRSKIEVLTVEEIETIHEAAVRIVREVGMMIGDEGILRMMKGH